MLSYDELLGYVKQLSPQERLTLIEATAHMVKEDLHLQAPAEAMRASSLAPLAEEDSANKYVPFIRKDWLYLDEEGLKAQGIELRGTPVNDILGIGWSAQNGLSPTDQEDRQDYINYLAEKYS